MASLTEKSTRSIGRLLLCRGTMTVNFLLCLLQLFALVKVSEGIKPALSTTCRDRCAMFVHPAERPRCQCDGMCLMHHDCCKDYERICLQEIVPEKSSKLAAWVAAIVGCVFAVVVILAVVYFCLIQKNEIRRMSVAGSFMNPGGGDTRGERSKSGTVTPQPQTFSTAR